MSDTPITDQFAELAEEYPAREVIPAHICSELERENSQLREQLKQNTVVLSDLQDAQAENDQLRARVEELEQDKARLDWLEGNSVELYCAGLFDGTNAGVVQREKNSIGKTIRAAIDAAKEAKP